MQPDGGIDRLGLFLILILPLPLCLSRGPFRDVCRRRKRLHGGVCPVRKSPSPWRTAWGDDDAV